MEAVGRSPVAISSTRSRHRFSVSKGAIGLAAVAFLLALFAPPFASVFRYVYGADAQLFIDKLSSQEALVSLMFALTLALATTAISGLMGPVLAFILADRRFPLRGVCGFLIELPMGIPASIAGLTLLLLYGPLELSGKHLDFGLGTISLDLTSILAVHVLGTLHVVVRSFGNGLATRDETEEEAARVLGASQLTIFTNLILPSIKGSMIVAWTSTFARSFGEFGATIILANNLALQSPAGPQFMFSEPTEAGVGAVNAMAAMMVVISMLLVAGVKLAHRFGK